jgi:hypothetical protein
MFYYFYQNKHDLQMCVDVFVSKMVAWRVHREDVTEYSVNACVKKKERNVYQDAKSSEISFR